MRPQRRIAAAAFASAAAAVLQLPGPAKGDSLSPSLQAGLYEVEVRLELPHLSAANASSSVKICIEEGRPARGLRVLSTNNPLGGCPIGEVSQQGAIVTFVVACAGANAARGAARFEIAKDRFRGTTAMKMGGKNMTMSEHQQGRRIGPCPQLAPPLRSSR